MAAKGKVGSSRWWIPDTWNSLHGDRLHWICKVSHLNFIECHCYMHTKPIKHLQIRGQWRSWIVSAGSQTQWASSFAGTAVHAVLPSHLLSQVSHTPVTPDHSWWQFDVPHCRSTRLQQSKPFICRSYGRFMYPVTCTKHAKRNTDSPTNNIPITHDSVYTSLSCSPNLLSPLKRLITAWIASLTDFLYLQPIVTW